MSTEHRRKARSNLLLFAVHLAIAAACFAGFYYKVTHG